MPIYAYACAACECVTETIRGYDDRLADNPCDSCGGPAQYTISAPGHFRIGYEQNGRKAVQINMGGGKKLYRSMTRENFERKAGNISAADYNKKNPFEKRKLNESVYTKGYIEHLKKEKKSAN